MRIVKIISSTARVLTDGYRIILTVTAGVYLVREIFSSRGHSGSERKAKKDVDNARNRAK